MSRQSPACGRDRAPCRARFRAHKRAGDRDASARRGARVHWQQLAVLIFVPYRNLILDPPHIMPDSTKINLARLSDTHEENCPRRPTMDLYFQPLACSMATRIALYEAGAEANYLEVDSPTKKVLKDGADFRAINPIGLVPTLRTDDG